MVTSPTPVTLATTIAGEDITSDRMKVSSETVLSTTKVISAVSAAPGTAGNTATAVYSAAIPCPAYRIYAIWAEPGPSGPLQVLLQLRWNGTDWAWHPNGFTATSQFPPAQIGVLAAPECRVAIINTHTGAQNVSAWLALQR